MEKKSRERTLMTTLLWIVLLGVMLMAGARLLVYYYSLSSHVRPVTLDLTFRLVDNDYKPIPNFAVRYVACSDKDWREPGSGYRFVTDAAGENHHTLSVILDQRWRRIPGNILATIWPPLRTDHFAIAVEMESQNVNLLYVEDMMRFRGNGCVLETGTPVFAADAQGRFVRHVYRAPTGGWILEGAPDEKVQSPGYTCGKFLLEPVSHDEKGEHWSLELAYKKNRAQLN